MSKRQLKNILTHLKKFTGYLEQKLSCAKHIDNNIVVIFLITQTVLLGPNRLFN